MGQDDKPDRLSPAQRDQYLNKYVPGKVARDETPKTPEKWLQATSFWQTQQMYGRAIEKGLDIVFGLPQQGWKPDVSDRHPKMGREIKVDRYLSQELSKDGRPANIECKAGAVKNERDLVQMQGYEAKLERGERVDYFTRAERAPQMSAPARELMDSLLKRYPDQFRVRAMNERVFQRVLEAGARAVEKEQREALSRNLAKIPARARENPARTIESIARDYVREIDRAKEAGSVSSSCGS